MTIDLTDIITAILGLAVTILTGIAIPTVRARVEAQKWEQFLSIVGVVVPAAKQIFVSGAHMEKLAYATERVNEAMAKAGLKYDAKTVRAAIEAAVLELKKV